MKPRSLAATTLALCLVPLSLASPGARAAAQEAGEPDYAGDEAVQPDAGESPERYAQVKVVEGDVTIHKGEADEPLTRGVPVTEGDVVESHGRGVLQLGDGSALAFGADCRFRIAALFSEQDQERRVLITLERGELRIRKGTQSDAILRVDTPSGTGTLGNRGNAPSRPDATFQVHPDHVTFLVHGGQAAFSNGSGSTQVFAGQRLTVYGPGDPLNRIAEFNAFSLDAFDQWSEDLVRPRAGESASRVPQEIRYYADDLDTNGRWVYVDDCSSWCWTPTVVEVDWRPYAYGRWGCYGGGMTWVSSEPWGYITYHHGRWGWAAGIGWYWIPGVHYGPAWVAWNCNGGYFGWAPLGYYNRPCRWNRGPWGGGPCWNVVRVDMVGVRDLRRHYDVNPVVFRSFNAVPVRRPPWFAGRVIIDRREFADPVRFQRVVSRPTVIHERVVVYDRTVQRNTGRGILLPPAPPRSQPAPFSTSERPGPQPRVPIFRPNQGQPGTPGSRPGRPVTPPAGNPGPLPPTTRVQPNRPVQQPGIVTPPASRPGPVPPTSQRPNQPNQPNQANHPPVLRTPTGERPRLDPSPARDRPRMDPQRPPVQDPRRVDPPQRPPVQEPRREAKPESRQESRPTRSETRVETKSEAKPKERK